MIEKINIGKIATFADQGAQINELKQINFFFGANGVGKTTISRVIFDSKRYLDCFIHWSGNQQLETRVYNKDFVDRNFSEEIKGVFTLGEQDIEAQQKINDEIANHRKITDDISNLEQGVQEKSKSRNNLELKYQDIFWKAKQKYGKNFDGALKGFLNSKESYKNMLIKESEENHAELQTKDYLVVKSSIYTRSPESFNPLTPIPSQSILLVEENPILSKQIVGKKDVDIAAMIEKIGNSDWVQQGTKYYDSKIRKCPFCQQTTPESFSKSLIDYFDETFIEDMSRIEELSSSYSNLSKDILQQINNILLCDCSLVDNSRLKTENELLKSIIEANKILFTQKKNEASRKVVLNSHKKVLKSIDEIVNEANEKIAANNKSAQNIGEEKKVLTLQIRRFLVEDQRNAIKEYQKEKKNLNAAISNLEKKKELKTKEKDDCNKSISELEKNIVSIQPTLKEINRLLVSFGFNSFHLEEGIGGRTYKLVRENGEDARNSLSEGEKNFVTFLYFFNLLKGSQTEDKASIDKIVVFDDPVSSLDNNVLFIVSTLIRELIDNVRKKEGSIKQIFIFTHNVFFHKEVTYSPKRRGGLLKDESFWLIKKSNKTSSIERQTTNPIKTTYELLWKDVRDKNQNKSAIQNSLRRILESYFTLLGGISLDEISNKFSGEDKSIFRSLVSWINQGSHASFFDDNFSSLNDASIENYLEVFKKVFQYSNNEGHYNMMMGID